MAVFTTPWFGYRLVDATGNKIGVPIKASSIACRPTLDNLEKKFGLHEQGREPFKASLKNVIDEAVAEGCRLR